MSWLRAAILSVALFTACGLIYSVGLPGDFLLDDSVTIVNSPTISAPDFAAADIWSAGLSGPSGLLRRPVSMLSLAANRYFTGMDPLHFKLTNIAIHLFNGISLALLGFLLLARLSDRTGPPDEHRQFFWVAIAAAALWAAHPLGLTTVLYITQRMTSLAAAFSVWSMIAYVIGRARMQQGGHGIGLVLVSVLVLIPLAILSKENGALTIYFLLLIECIFFRFSTTTAANRRFITALFVITAALPALAAAAFLLTDDAWLSNAYRMRDFSPYERLLTQARVLWLYLSWIIAPVPHALGLYHDDIAVSKSLLSPASTGVAVTGILVLIALASVTYRRAPMLSFGIGFFLLGHSLESSILSLEIAHEHRNYLPMFGPILALTYYAAAGLRTNLRLAALLGFAFFVVLGGITALRAAYWSNIFDHAIAETMHHPSSPRAQYQAGRIYATLMTRDADNAEMHYQLAKRHFTSALALDHDSVSAMIALVILDESAGNSADTALLSQLEYALGNSPFRATNAAGLHSLVSCQKSKACKLPPRILTSLLDAAVQNPSARGTSRASLLASGSDFYANVLGRYNEAVGFAYAAADAAPKELQYRINLVRILIATRQHGEAARELEQLRRLDRFGIHTTSITHLEQSIPH